MTNIPPVPKGMLRTKEDWQTYVERRDEDPPLLLDPDAFSNLNAQERDVYKKRRLRHHS